MCVCDNAEYEPAHLDFLRACGCARLAMDRLNLQHKMKDNTNNYIHDRRGKGESGRFLLRYSRVGDTLSVHYLAILVDNRCMCL